MALAVGLRLCARAPVVAPGAVNRVAARAAIHAIVSSTPVKRVVSSSSGDEVSVRPTHDGVVAGAAVERLVGLASGPEDQVVESGAVDQLDV